MNELAEQMLTMRFGRKVNDHVELTALEFLSNVVPLGALFVCWVVDLVWPSGRSANHLASNRWLNRRIEWGKLIWNVLVPANVSRFGDKWWAIVAKWSVTSFSSWLIFTATVPNDWGSTLQMSPATKHSSNLNRAPADQSSNIQISILKYNLIDKNSNDESITDQCPPSATRSDNSNGNSTHLRSIQKSCGNLRKTLLKFSFGT